MIQTPVLLTILEEEFLLPLFSHICIKKRLLPALLVDSRLEEPTFK